MENGSVPKGEEIWVWRYLELFDWVCLDYAQRSGKTYVYSTAT